MSFCPGFKSTMVFLKTIACFILLSAFSAGLCAQQVSGTVSNEQNGEAIEFANIVLTPGGYGTMTDQSGEFEIVKIPVGKYKLSISMLGFKTKSIDIEIESEQALHLKIGLLPERKRIDEVEVLSNYQQNNVLDNPTTERNVILPSISKVSKLEIEKQGATTLIEALKYTPGGWTETRGRKVKQFFSIRGQKYPYPSYSINGIWQKEFHEMPYFFNSSNIEEIKIVRSSAALINSLSALAGIIDVTTKQPQDRQTGFYLKYGSLNSYQTSISHENSFEKFNYNVGINGSGTEGPENRNGRENIWNMNGSFNWKIDNKLDLAMNLFYMMGMRQLVQPVEPAADKFRVQKERYDPYASFIVSSKLKYKANEKLTNELQINYAGRNPKFINENTETGDITEYVEKDYEITVNQINALALGRKNILRFGALYNYWIAPEGKRFYYGRRAEVHTVSGVVTDQHNFGKLLLDAGFRLTREYYAEWGSFNIEGSGGKFGNVEPIVDQWQAPVWQVTSGATYPINKSASLHFTMASGIINPRKGALTEQGQTPKNENRSNFDLGYLRNFDKGGKISVSAFWVDRKNAIEYSGETIELGENEIMELYRNTNKHNYGLEVDLKSPVLFNSISFFSNFTVMKGEIEHDNEWDEDEEMPNVVANLGVNFQKDRLDMNTYLNYIGEYENDRFVSKSYLNEFGKAPLGNFINFDLTVGYLLGKAKRTRVFAEGKNLFDKAFHTVPGYPDYGRLLSTGISFNF